MSVLEHVEIAFIEGGDDVLLVVDDRGMQHHFLDLLAENEDAVVGGIRILSRVGRWRLGWGWGIRRRLVPGSTLRLRCRQKQRCQEEENPWTNIIPSAHSNPSWRRPGAAAILLAARASLLFYAICRRALGSLDGIREHIGCVTRCRFLWKRPPGRSGYRW